MKYRKKPVVIEAVQFNGYDVAPEFVSKEIALFLEEAVISYENGCLFINTLEGTMRAEKGDWIIKGVKGEFYPCKPDIFEATYEKVD